MFSMNYIFLLNITYVFAIITCFGFLVTCIRPLKYYFSNQVFGLLQAKLESMGAIAYPRVNIHIL